MASTSRMWARNWLPRPFALRRAAHETGDVDERQAGRDDLGRPGDRRQLVEARVGHGDFADVGLDRAEGIVRRLGRRRLRQRVEERRLADVGQADDAAFETHVVLSFVLVVAGATGASGHPAFEVFSQSVLAF